MGDGSAMSTETRPGNGLSWAQPEARRDLRRPAWLEWGEWGHRKRQRGKQQTMEGLQVR